MNNGQMDCGKENPSLHLPWWLRKTTKNPSQVGRHRDLNPDLPNASLVRYHGATSLGSGYFVSFL